MQKAVISMPDLKEKKVITNQTAMDIAKAMLVSEKRSRPTSKKIAELFKGTDKLKTCRIIYDFMRKNLPYEKESEERQTAKTINRILFDGKNELGNDCKHYATFGVGVLNACGIPCFFRLVSQNYFDKAPTHAYCVCLIGGNEIIIDGVKPLFDDEVSYRYKYDFKPLK